jgi:hypothetical protein
LYEGESGVFEDDSLKLRNAKGFKEKPQPTAWLVATWGTVVVMHVP